MASMTRPAELQGASAARVGVGHSCPIMPDTHHAVKGTRMCAYDPTFTVHQTKASRNVYFCRVCAFCPIMSVIGLDTDYDAPRRIAGRVYCVPSLRSTHNRRQHNPSTVKLDGKSRLLPAQRWTQRVRTSRRPVVRQRLMLVSMGQRQHVAPTTAPPGQHAAHRVHAAADEWFATPLWRR